MNYWAAMLGETPALLQRLIARAQRVSLPRRCSYEERTSRLRAALCHAASVRAAYTLLDLPTQDAILELRTRRGGIKPDELVERYGCIRPLRAIAEDPRPRSVAERLMLIGWLLPRPERPRHPACYRVPPEVRAWLPQPLALTGLGSAPAASPHLPPALHATAAILLLAAEQPLHVRLDGTPRLNTVRAVRSRLGSYTLAETADLCTFVLPLLAQLGLVLNGGKGWMQGLVARSFLDRTPEEQLQELRKAWLVSPQPDHWLCDVGADPIGIDWPLFRARLRAWAATLPVGRVFESNTLYQELAASLGPLGDAQTHGFRTVSRSPWQPRRAAAVFGAALRGPLAWLGEVVPVAGHTDGARVCRSRIYRPEQQITLQPMAWRYGQPGEIHIPHSCFNSDALCLLPTMQWHESDADGVVLRLTPASIARSARRGGSLQHLLVVVERHAGPAPCGWDSELPLSEPALRLTSGTLLIDEQGDVLRRAATDRSVRRYLGNRIAPGVALVAPEHVGRLARTLQSEGVAVEFASSHQNPVDTTSGLSASEAASLLVACAFARCHAAQPLSPLPDETLERRLWARLPQQHRHTTQAAIDRICDVPSYNSSSTDEHHDWAVSDKQSQSSPPRADPVAPAELLKQLRHAVRHGRSLRMQYTNQAGTQSLRTIRPLAVEHTGDRWYVDAYCSTRHEERRFRLDRIVSVEPAFRSAW